MRFVVLELSLEEGTRRLGRGIKARIMRSEREHGFGYHVIEVYRHRGRPQGVIRQMIREALGLPGHHAIFSDS